jgi:hypothetical protein
MQNTGENYLASAKKIFRSYKSTADRAIAQLNDEQLHWQYNTATNSIAIIMQHMAGNSLSRWTDFLNSDGEKAWRDRDAEFENSATTTTELLALWEKGWQCIFEALAPLTENDLMRIIYIRSEAHTVIEAINRQLTHLAYHVGQIVFVAKMLAGDEWQSLSIPKGQSKQFNEGKFGKKS